MSKLFSAITAGVFSVGLLAACASEPANTPAADRPSGTNVRGEEVKDPNTGGTYDKQDAPDRPSGTNIRGEQVTDPKTGGEYDDQQNAPDRPSGQNAPSR